MTRAQLREFGWSDRSVDVQIGRLLHPVHRGVFAVGDMRMTDRRRWRAALLACGPAAALSHESAATLWGLIRHDHQTHVSVPAHQHPQRAGIRVHRRTAMPRSRFQDGLRVSDPIDTLIDVASAWSESRLEAALDHGDKNRLFTIDAVRMRLGEVRRSVGVRRLIAILASYDRTDSILEDEFLSLVAAARLPTPKTQQKLLGFRVDFLWPELRLVVETDGLTFHRTPMQQAKDRVRDQRLTAAGYTCLRFTRQQVRHDPANVVRTLRTVIRRLTT